MHPLAKRKIVWENLSTKKNVTWRIMEVIPNNDSPRRPSGSLPTSEMHGGSSIIILEVACVVTTLVQLCWILRSNFGKKVGWVVTMLVFTKNTGSGWFSIAQNGCNNSFKSSNTTTSSIQYVVFSACSISKNVGTTPQPSEKKNIRQGATPPHWRRAWEPEGLWFYDYQTPGGVNTPGLQKMAKGEQKLH